MVETNGQAHQRTKRGNRRGNVVVGYPDFLGTWWHYSRIRLACRRLFAPVEFRVALADGIKGPPLGFDADGVGLLSNFERRIRVRERVHVRAWE